MELADVAQLVVRRTCNAKDAGSSPVISSYDLVDLDEICIMEDSVSY